jgi:integrase
VLLDKAVESLAESIRTVVGTPEILSDPDAHFAQATVVDEWAARQGKDFFGPSHGDITLSTFFEKWYRPQKLFDATQSTIESYEQVLKMWRRLIGDPPVKQITPTMLALFRGARLRMKGLNGHTLSPNTVRSNLRHLQVLLEKLGPPARGNRDGQRILADVPWVQPPREVVKIPRTVALEWLSACYEAAKGMRKPVIPGVRAPAYWRALLVVVWNTGLRRGTLFAMRWEDVDLEHPRIVLPAARMKSRRPMIVHLTPVAAEALRSICTDGELVFPWETSTQWKWRFPHLFHELQNLAGIPKKEHFGLHMIRKTVASALWEVSPGAAQFALGHTTADVTRKHYVDGGELVARALDQLPQPDAFTTNSSPATAPRQERSHTHVR